MGEASNRSTSLRHVSTGVLTRVFSPDLIDRVVAECGTHATVDAVIAKCSETERSLASPLMDSLAAAMVLLADWGFFSCKYSLNPCSTEGCWSQTPR
ncbi:MAG: transposase domain-containing protein [Acidimicrobiales bacterium]